MNSCNTVIFLATTIICSLSTLNCHENRLLCCSSFPNDVLRSLSDHVVSQSVDCILPNLTHHLKLLSLAMRATDIPPAVSDLMGCSSDIFSYLPGQVFI